MAYLKKISTLGKIVFPSLMWKISTEEKKIFLTFDDGPIPEITPWVLSLLKEYNAKATFFCIGENVQKYPDVFARILAEGHKTGNHTFNHLNGWNTPPGVYLENVLMAEEELLKHNVSSPYNSEKLFRPPYGRITPRQIKILKQNGYKIVMWDVISGDFDKKLSAKECFGNVVNHAAAGSIIVFHDSLKASEKLQKVLPGILEYYKNKGFEFKSL